MRNGKPDWLQKNNPKHELCIQNSGTMGYCPFFISANVIFKTLAGKGQACHAYVQNKASTALLWKDKFEMQLFTLCKAHQKYIINVDRNTVGTHYDEEFVALVNYVVLWRSKVSKTVENIVHRPALKKRRGGKLRSRNIYVDEHLRTENGKDTYADLEDFIVGDDDDVD